MKIYLILILSTLVGCSSYTVTKVKDDQVMISKTTQVLFFWGGTISTCGLDKDGLFKKCEENVIQGEEVLKKPIVEKPVIPVIVEKSMPIKEEVKKNEIVKKEPVPVIEKPIMVQKKDMDKNKIYIGLGISTIDEPDLGKDLDSVLMGVLLM